MNIDDKYSDMMQRSIDRTTSVKEEEELRSYLLSNSEAQSVFEDLTTMANELNAVPTPSVSPNLKKIVLNLTVSRLGNTKPPKRFNLLQLFLPTHNSRHVSHNVQEGVMKKKAIVGGFAFFAIAVIYLAVLYPWPASNGDVQGTIGGVKKYNAYQMSDRDVQISQQSLTPAENIDPEVVLAFYHSAPMAAREAFIQKSESSVLQKGESSVLHKGESSVLQKGESSVLQKGESSVMQKSIELQRAQMYWNSASVQAKEQFYRTWLEKTEGLSKTDLQKSGGDQ